MQQTLFTFPPCSENRDDCRFSNGPMMSTAMYFPPVYDRNGNNLNEDGNTTTWTTTCHQCGKQWTCSSQKGNTTFTELPPVL